MLLLFLVLACLETSSPGPGPEVWSEPVAHDDERFLFDQTRINRIDLTLGDDALKILRRERVFTQPRNEVRGQATIDGEELGAIGVRLRGGAGSFQRFDAKPKWELDFNEFSGERFHGLESLSLNNAAQECWGGNDHLAFFVNGEAGVPSSRSGHAQLFVNGLDYGLYVALETQDDRWLKRHFDDNDGNFYDGGYVQAGPWPVVLDFGRGRDHLFDLEEGEDNGAVDIRAVSAEVEAAENNGGVSQTLWGLVDWDRLLRKFAVEQWTHNDDAYAPTPNNYRVYFPTDGPMVMTPWDQDSTFRQVDEDPNDPYGDARFKTPAGALAQICSRDPECLAEWADAARAVADELDAPEVLAFVETFNAVTTEGLDADPRGTCAVDTREEARAAAVDWVLAASEKLRDSWAEQ